ncbi:non-ribosomal peptide synthetase [Rhizobacter sp. OV335]|uniref:non-ribosomal peptide synthetase n=1 Tax=Rhizobacter sp. OV335 TaxID=1500264 RepID=UPI0009138E6D|nr:non-ribosomal peptide synthetase [Rhizobacter sp. OV335]SHN31623.1 amino acid adenylation domain-containing protein [Rhizobacter sp. OV335]
MTIELASLSHRFVQLPPGKRAAFIERLRAEGIGFDALPLIAREPGTPAPLAPAQRALWLAWQRAPQSPAYNLAGRLRIRGTCSADDVQVALRRLVQRHAVLRTRIALDADGQAVQVVDEAADAFGWSVHGACTDADARAFAARPFDLERGPVFRAALHREPDGGLVLLLGVHHIAADGGSVALLLQELSSLLRDPGRTLERPALQYADHAQWQQRWLEAGELARQQAWWVDELRDAPLATTLPLDRPRRAPRSARGELLGFGLPPETGDALLALARRDAASPAMVTLALLALLLHRYGGDRDVCIGVPSANRDRAELAGMVGHFTNVMVLRLRIDPQAGFAALLRQVRERLLAARQQAHLPLDQLVEALGVERSAGLHPLFQVKCASQATGGASGLPAEGGLQIDIDGVAVDEVHFDLSLDVMENARGLDFQLAWAIDLFDRATVDRLAAAFVDLAAQVATDPQRALASTTLPGEPSVLHGEPVKWPWQSVPALWAVQAVRHAQRPAVVGADGAHTHAQLERAARGLAAQLGQRGIGAEARVALLLERSSAFVLAMLAVMKAGAVVVPLDPSLPVPRLQALVRDCGARALMAAAPVPWSTLPVIEPRFDAPLPLLLPPEPVLLPDQAAYLIYTSGSTGAPKGVVVSHGALANYAQSMLARLALPGEALNFAMVSTVAADLGHTTLFGALCSGGSLLMLDPAAAFDPDAFADAMQRHRIDVLKIVPSHLKGLLNAARPQDVLPAHTLVLGGEVADAALIAAVRTLRPGLRIVNHYGPTETCVGMLMHVAAETDAALPLGRPIGGMSAFALDDALEPVQPGIAGELYVGGPGVARGYQGQPGLTASRFVASPFKPGERLYRTGDRVRQRSDGALVFLGRSDDQLKIRGFRVEPGELQARMREMDGVADAAVLPGESEAGATVLWAYVVPRVGAVLDAATLRLALQASLPGWLVPEAIVVLDAMPLTANGKIDRKALPRPVQAAVARPIEPPRGPTEQALARLFGEVLGLDAVGRDDDFFELGGDSILSLKLIARIRKQVPGGTGLALSEVMQATRLRDLAGRLQQRLEQQHDAICLHAGGAGVPLYCLPGMIVNSREFLPLTEALQGMRPVHGFVSHVYTRRRWRGFAVQALAAEYAAFIEATAVQGRCALLGWSSGGDLAIEVARQLQGRVAVDFVGMVDVFETEPLRASRPLGAAERALAWREIDAWVGRSTMAEAWRELFTRLDDIERDGLAEQVLVGDRALPLDGDGDDAAEVLLWATLDKRSQGARYQHGRIDTPMHVFHAGQSVNDTAGRLRDWAVHAPVVATTVIDGASHLDIIRRPQLHEALRLALP